MRTVTPPTRTGSSSRERVQVAELADVPVHRDQARLGDRRRELPGDRPARVAPDRAEPALQLEVRDLHDDAVDLESSRAAAVLPLQALLDDRLLVVEHDDLVVDGEAVLAQPLEHLPLVGELEALDDADA